MNTNSAFANVVLVVLGIAVCTYSMCIGVDSCWSNPNVGKGNSSY